MTDDRRPIEEEADVGEPGDEAGDRWQLRTVPEERARRYRDEGWWTDQTLGRWSTPASAGWVTCPSGSTRPSTRGGGPSPTWTGRHGRWPARWPPRGSARGTCLVFQLPNWMEAGITFWAAAYLGAVVVPIVHFYGPKEVEYILRMTAPAVVVTADHFGHNDFLSPAEAITEVTTRSRKSRSWLTSRTVPG